MLRRSAQNARDESTSRKQLAAVAPASFLPSRWRRLVRCFPMNLSSVTFAIIRACTTRARPNTRTLIAKRPFGVKSQTPSACRVSGTLFPYSIASLQRPLCIPPCLKFDFVPFGLLWRGDRCRVEPTHRVGTDVKGTGGLCCVASQHVRRHVAAPLGNRGRRRTSLSLPFTAAFSTGSLFFLSFFLHFGIVFSSLLSFFFFFFFGSWKKQSVSSRDKSQIALLECNYYLEYDSTNVLIEVSRNVDMSFAGIWKQLRSNSVEHRRTDSPVDDSENQNAVDIQTEMAAKR